ncbi:MAG: GDP-L-fucose synthase [Sterolibacterium sp.]|jgi:GDP-L-fucose synthase|nr:GDP-L-fucose synthase [Sterolibacterium sp.]
MDKHAKIYVAGHRGLVGSAIVRALQKQGYDNLLLRTHAELDLMEQAPVRAFMEAERPDHVILAAAKVGGIHANNTYPAEFIHSNLAVQTNVLHESWRIGVQRLLFLGSSCIYPRNCPQPIREDYLLTGPLEATNRPYALAKIAGIEMCWSYNRQYGTKFIACMPTNLYGPGDNYDLANSHVLPALIRKMHEAKVRGDQEVVIWGTGTPLREFLNSDDMAEACLHLMQLPENRYVELLTLDGPPLVNIGCGSDQTIRTMAELVAKTVGFQGELRFDVTQPDGTPRKLLEVTRMTQLGWKARIPLATGLADAYADFLEHHA